MDRTSLPRKVLKSDHDSIKKLLRNKERVHRHLDWRTPLDWIGSNNYWLLERNNIIQAALACPIDPPGVAWIRFFTASPDIHFNDAWIPLFERAKDEFTSSPKMIASVSTHDWYTKLLLNNGFTFHQNIVVLDWKTQAVKYQPPLHNVSIIKMKETDLDAVTELDNQAFDILWQDSLDGITTAFHQSSYSTVAVIENDIIGYQISSSTPINAHLARLAVSPDHQGKGIGYLLTHDMIRRFNKNGIGYITVNTQHDNLASLQLYKNLGFKITPGSFHVLKYIEENQIQ